MFRIVLVLAAVLSISAIAAPLCVVAPDRRDCWYETVATCKAAALEKLATCEAEDGSPIELYVKEKKAKQAEIDNEAWMIFGVTFLLGVVFLAIVES